MKEAVRYSWRTAFFILLFITLIALIFLATSSETDEFDKNLVANIIMLGVFASLPFFVLAFRVSSNPKNRMTTASPCRICLSIKRGLFLTLAYWACVLLIALSGSDSDGIMCGLMFFLYPFIFIPIILILSRSKK